MEDNKLFYLPTEIITGFGCMAELGRVAGRYGWRAMVVCGQKAMRQAGILDKAVEILRQAGLKASVYDAIAGEPTLNMVEEGRALALRESVEVVVGLGGGSAMDAAKAIAGLFTQEGTAEEYFQGRKIEGPGLPWVAIPTTAGTGAEVTKNAVLTDTKRGEKSSIRSDYWFARVALVDPALTLPAPPSVTASSGGDALCQAIESYVSIGAGPVTDALAAQAIVLIGRSLVRACEKGDDIEARSDMLYGSLLAGMALTNARLGAVHGLAHPLGSRYKIPHGKVCGLLLPYIMEYNLDYATAKYAHIARLLNVDTKGLSEREAAERAVEAVWEIMEKIHIPLHLREFGVREEDFPQIISESLPSGSLKHNPRPMGAEDLRIVLQKAL
ncbi:MAG: iron-containing alcohol dehydrogenase family protein [Anaerolineae bacterium]